jgi:hypothetical protein
MIVLVDVLSGDDKAWMAVLKNGGQADEGWGNADIDVVGKGKINDVLGGKGESLGLLRSLIHFPVA